MLKLVVHCRLSIFKDNFCLYTVVSVWDVLCPFAVLSIVGHIHILTSYRHCDHCPLSIVGHCVLLPLCPWWNILWDITYLSIVQMKFHICLHIFFCFCILHIFQYVAFFISNLMAFFLHIVAHLHIFVAFTCYHSYIHIFIYSCICFVAAFLHIFQFVAFFHF